MSSPSTRTASCCRSTASAWCTSWSRRAPGDRHRADPYSAFTGSATRLERIAGATTDLQHIVHQGLTYYDATVLVGANAVIRKRALDDISETSTSRRLADPSLHIRNRTVIEARVPIDMGIHARGCQRPPSG